MIMFFSFLTLLFFRVLFEPELKLKFINTSENTQVVDEKSAARHPMQYLFFAVGVAFWFSFMSSLMSHSQPMKSNLGIFVFIAAGVFYANQLRRDLLKESSTFNNSVEASLDRAMVQIDRVKYHKIFLLNSDLHVLIGGSLALFNVSKLF